MEILFWIISILLISFGSLFIVFNFWIFVRSTIFRKHAPSVAPIIGGIITAVGIFLIPVEGVYKFAWIPLILDVACVPYLLLFLMYEIYFKIKERK